MSRDSVTSQRPNGSDTGKEHSVKRTHLLRGVLPSAALFVAGVAALAPPATLEAQSPARGDGTQVASAAVWAGGVDLTPEVRYREAVVTVSGNGRVFRQAVKAGGDLSIGVFDPEGQLLPDGVYKWELELVPDTRTAAKLRAAAASNGGVAPNAWRRESGTFAIYNGLVVAPDLVEAVQGRPAAAGAVLPAAVGAASADRRASGDDDAAVGSRKGVEASTRAARESQPQLAAAAPLEGEALERSDVAARALGVSLERTSAAQNLPGEAEPPRRSILDSNDPENGRDRSEKHR